MPVEIPQGHDDYPFVHVAWSNLGNDLAIMNAAGHVMIYACALVLDRMSTARAEVAQPEVETDAVVGMHWLAMIPYEQKVIRPPSREQNVLMSIEPSCMASNETGRWVEV